MSERIDVLLSEGLAHFAGGQHGPATECFNAALQLDSGNVRAREFLSYVRTSTPPVAVLASDVGRIPAPTSPPAPLASYTSLFAPPVATTAALDESEVDAADVLDEKAAGQPNAATGPWDMNSVPNARVAVHIESEAPPPPRRNPFSDIPTTETAPQSKSKTLTLPALGSEDANADGLRALWGDTGQIANDALPPLPPASVEVASGASPWDDGPASAATVDLDRAGPAPASKPRESTRPPAGVPRTTVPPPPDDPTALMARVREHHELGDFSGSLEIVEKVLELDANNAEARDYLERNEATLLKMYESKIGDLTRVPRTVMSPDEVIWLNLHHKAGFLLSRVDGLGSFEDILALSGMGRLETCRILAQLVKAGVIKA